ncbi:MAG: MerR family transcriptional regulator [Solirubrobacterales bacterium]
MTAGDLAALTGATPRMVHDWAGEDLLPSFREGDDRRFYSAALIRAFVLQGASGHSKAALGAAARGKAA